MDAAFQDGSFDVVDICLPVAVHATHVLRALAAGKHAVVELPLASCIGSDRPDGTPGLSTLRSGRPPARAPARFAPANRGA